MMDQNGLNVSRETLERLKAFISLVEKWTAKINLISKFSTADIWERHIVDSAQIHALAPETGLWVDLGSGGGFPGLVAAILSHGEGFAHQFKLVESDQRKAVFLRTAIRELELDVHVESKRIEDIEPLQADIVSARALADLKQLLSFAHRHLAPDGVAVFPKGETWQKEVHAARLRWSYSCEPIRSRTNQQAAILKIKDISCV
jgi:16S rRNA (guanine527-N7)-methyltransferase